MITLIMPQIQCKIYKYEITCFPDVLRAPVRMDVLFLKKEIQNLCEC